MHILAIETSCDETGIALVEASGGLRKPLFEIKKNLVASQVKIHEPFGGVVPNLAKREHLLNLPILLKKLQITNRGLQNIDLIAVTVGPGLEPALWTGINFAKEIQQKFKIQNSKLKIPIIGVSHLEGHLYSFLLSHKKTLSYKKAVSMFPAIALIVSGGHTILVKMDSLIKYKKIGETRDDAVGETFDKVARLLGLKYPGGPEIEKLAKQGSSASINFPRPMIHQKNYDFSFSGLKTAVLYYMRDAAEVEEKISFLRKLNGSAARFFRGEAAKSGVSGLSKKEIFSTKTDIAASFQQAAFDVLISKALRAAQEFNAKTIFVSGGVSQNISLKKYFEFRIKNLELRINLIFPEKKFCGDNAAMIAAAGYINFLRGKNRRLVARSDISLS